MVEPISVEDQRWAVQLYTTAFSLVGQDDVWTSRLSPVRFSPDDASGLAEVGRQMAAELGYLLAQLPWIEKIALTVDHELTTRQDLAELRAVLMAAAESSESVVTLVAQACDVVRDNAPREIESLLEKSGLLAAGEYPQGDLPPRLRGALVAIGGALLIALGVATGIAFAPVGGPVAVGVGSGVTLAGAQVFGAGCKYLLDQSGS